MYRSKEPQTRGVGWVSPSIGGWTWTKWNRSNLHLSSNVISIVIFRIVPGNTQSVCPLQSTFARLATVHITAASLVRWGSGLTIPLLRRLHVLQATTRNAVQPSGIQESFVIPRLQLRQQRQCQEICHYFLSQSLPELPTVIQHQGNEGSLSHLTRGCGSTGRHSRRGLGPALHRPLRLSSMGVQVKACPEQGG